MADVINEAKQQSLLRVQAQKTKRKAQEIIETLCIEDLESSLRLYRISSKRKAAIRPDLSQK